MSMISWTADEGMLSPSQFFCPCLSSPCRRLTPRRVLRSGVPMSWPGFWLENKAILCRTIYREHMVCIYFVIGFYHLVERCYCGWSEWAFRHRLADASCFFARVTDLGGTSTRPPWKYFLSRRLPLSFYLKFSLFACGQGFPEANNLANSCVSNSTPPQLQPMIMLGAFCVMLWLVTGQLKDKLLLNKSMTLSKTNRAVKRV